jgi:hypothetical protein
MVVDNYEFNNYNSRMVFSKNDKKKLTTCGNNV